jgi:hypothetical protein
MTLFTSGLTHPCGLEQSSQQSTFKTGMLFGENMAVQNTGTLIQMYLDDNSHYEHDLLV